MFSCPFSVCHWRRRFTLIHRIPFRAGVRRYPFQRRCPLMCRSSLMRHDLIGSIYVQLLENDLLFPERISTNPLPYCFDSGFSPHTFQAFWPSPVFNPPEFLIMFIWQIDEHSRNFQQFYGFGNLRMGFSALRKGNHSHMVFIWHPTPYWRCDRWEQTALAQVPEGMVVQKQPSLQPSHLIFSSFGQHESCNRTYGTSYYYH